MLSILFHINSGSWLWNLVQISWGDRLQSLTFSCLHIRQLRSHVIINLEFVSPDECTSLPPVDQWNSVKPSTGVCLVSNVREIWFDCRTFFFNLSGVKSVQMCAVCKHLTHFQKPCGSRRSICPLTQPQLSVLISDGCSRFPPPDRCCFYSDSAAVSDTEKRGRR